MGAFSQSAFDSAADSAYDSGWTTGTNGGYGFSAWDIFNYGSPEATTYTATNGNVDIKSSGRAWGMAGSNETFSYAGTEATRKVNAPLSVGQTFSLDIDNGIQNAVPGSFADGGFGLSLKDAAGAERLAFFAFTSVPNFYYFTDDAGNRQSIGLIESGFNLAVTLTDADSYSAVISPIGGSATSINGKLRAGGAINLVRLWQYNLVSGAGGENDSYFNNMQVVPEPASMAALAVGLLALRRRRKAA